MNPDLKLFFTTPTVFKTGQVSTLYLLRRDIYTCLGKPMGEIQAKIGTHTPIAIWPSIMLIMTGIDLLSKFYCGNDTRSEVSKRFKCFVQKYISNKNVNEIYHLRNALIHGFSLYSEDKGKIYRYALGCYEDEMVYVAPDEKIWISISHLHKAFEYSIELFKLEYSNLPSSANFDYLFSKYGWVYIRGN
jgi:hypothetical protein